MVLKLDFWSISQFLVVLFYLRPALGLVNYNITNVAGNGTFGFGGDDGLSQNSMMKIVKGVWVSSVNYIYISDTTNFKVRVVDSSHIIRTYSGQTNTPSGDGGAASSASLGQPWGLYGDSVSAFYITSVSGNAIRAVDLSTDIISTQAGTGVASSTSTASNGDGGKATAATFSAPSYVFADSVGSLFVADAGNNRVRKVDSSKTISTVAGTGTYGAGADGLAGTSTNFKSISGLWLDSNGNMYVGDFGSKLREIDATLGTGSTVAGTGTSGSTGNNGKATSALLGSTVAVWGDSVGQLFISTGNQIRIVDLASNIITLCAGSTSSGHSGDGGMAVDALLRSPLQLYGTQSGHYYFADSSNSVVRQVMVAPIAPTMQPTTIAPTSSLPTVIPTSSKPTVTPTTTKPTATPSTRVPTMPTPVPTRNPTVVPTTAIPSEAPTVLPTRTPTAPTQFPALKPTPGPTPRPTFDPTPLPTRPTVVPTTALPTTTQPTPLPTTANPTSPTVVPTTASPTVVPTSAFPSFTHPSPIPTRFHPSLKPTQMPTTRRPTPVPTASPTQPYKDIWYTTTLCFHHLRVAELSPTDEVVVALAVSDVLSANESLIHVMSQQTVSRDSVTTYQVCIKVYCQARTLDYYWVIDSNATQLYFGLRNIFDASIANDTFSQVLNETATIHNATDLMEYSSVDATYSNFKVIVFVPETHDDWLSPEEVGSVTAISIVATLVCLSLGLAVCSVMEEKGF